MLCVSAVCKLQCSSLYADPCKSLHATISPDDPERKQLRKHPACLACCDTRGTDLHYARGNV